MSNEKKDKEFTSPKDDAKQITKEIKDNEKKNPPKESKSTDKKK